MIGTLATELEEQRSGYSGPKKQHTRGVVPAVSALGRLAMANGRALDVHMMYDLDQSVYKEQGVDVARTDGGAGSIALGEDKNADNRQRH